jgi:hypothetical protein
MCPTSILPDHLDLDIKEYSHDANENQQQKVEHQEVQFLQGLENAATESMAANDSGRGRQLWEWEIILIAGVHRTDRGWW